MSAIDNPLILLGVPTDWPDGIVAALRAGRNVLATIPPAATEDDFRAIADGCGSGHSVFVPAFAELCRPQLAAVRDAVRAGRIGLPWNVQVTVVGPAPDGLWARAVPLVDAVLELTGLPISRVYAQEGSSLVLALDHDRGVGSTVSISAAERPMAHAYRLSGSSGLLVADGLRPAVAVRVGDRVDSVWEGVSTEEQLRREFAVAVAAGRPEIGRAGRASMIVAAAIRSARQRQPVEVERGTAQ